MPLALAHALRRSALALLLVTPGCGIEAEGSLDALPAGSAGLSGASGQSGAPSAGAPAGGQGGLGPQGGQAPAGQGGAGAGGQGGSSGQSGKAGNAGDGGSEPGGAGGQGGSAGAPAGQGGAAPGGMSGSALGGQAGQGGGAGEAGMGQGGLAGSPQGGAGAGGAGQSGAGQAGAGGAGQAGMSGSSGQGGAGQGGAGQAGAGQAGAGAGGAGQAGVGGAGQGGLSGSSGQGGAGLGGGGMGGGNTVCGQVPEGMPLTLTCPAGQVIEKVMFASYGTPQGSCGAFGKSGCDAATSVARVEQACLQRPSCTVAAINDLFGDPCASVNKQLVAEVRCGAPSVTCNDGVLDAGEGCDGVSPTCQSCAIACPDGFVSPDSGSCYQPSTTSLTWQNARTACTNLGPGCDLVSLETTDELQFIASRVATTSWTGGQRSPSSWGPMPGYGWVSLEPWKHGPSARWLAGQGGEGPSANWGSGEPSNVDAERCVVLRGTGDQLDARNCNDTSRYVCECRIPRAPCDHDGQIEGDEECDDGNLVNGDGCSSGCLVECPASGSTLFSIKDPVSHHCYSALKDATDWNGAHAACAALSADTHLTLLGPNDEVVFLSRVLRERLSPATPWLWIDASDQATEGTFLTKSGAPFGFTPKQYPWFDNEPNNFNNEDCVGFSWFGQVYLVNDMPCAAAGVLPLCESEP